MSPNNLSVKNKQDPIVNNNQLYISNKQGLTTAEVDNYKKTLNSLISKNKNIIQIIIPKSSLQDDNINDISYLINELINNNKYKSKFKVGLISNGVIG